MNARIDKSQFGPWAVITGASSGIGREFARQIAHAGLNTVLVGRRSALLDDVGRSLTRNSGVQFRVITADFSEDDFITTVARQTADLDVGLLVSNAGTPSPGKFLALDRAELADGLRLNALSHLEIAHHFGRRLVSRGRGGLLFVGAMGAGKGVPYMVNDSAAKAYVHGLAKGLHQELKPAGIHVTLLAPGPTDTPALAVLGLTPENLPMRPTKVDLCVSEALRSLAANRALIIPGRMNRMMDALVPEGLAQKMMGKMFQKSLAAKTPPPQAQAQVG